MRWTDIYDIAFELSNCYKSVDPKTINFVDLRNWIVGLEGFSDDPERCGEKILEAIQQAWIEEMQ